MPVDVSKLLEGQTLVLGREGKVEELYRLQRGPLGYELFYARPDTKSFVFGGKTYASRDLARSYLETKSVGFEVGYARETKDAKDIFKSKMSPAAEGASDSRPQSQHSRADSPRPSREHRQTSDINSEQRARTEPPTATTERRSDDRARLSGPERPRGEIDWNAAASAAGQSLVAGVGLLAAGAAIGAVVSAPVFLGIGAVVLAGGTANSYFGRAAEALEAGQTDYVGRALMAGISDSLPVDLIGFLEVAGGRNWMTRNAIPAQERSQKLGSLAAGGVADAGGAMANALGALAKKARSRSASSEPTPPSQDKRARSEGPGVDEDLKIRQGWDVESSPAFNRLFDKGVIARKEVSRDLRQTAAGQFQLEEAGDIPWEYSLYLKNGDRVDPDMIGLDADDLIVLIDTKHTNMFRPDTKGWEPDIAHRFLLDVEGKQGQIRKYLKGIVENPGEISHVELRCNHTSVAIALYQIISDMNLPAASRARITISQTHGVP